MENGEDQDLALKGCANVTDLSQNVLENSRVQLRKQFAPRHLGDSFKTYL